MTQRRERQRHQRGDLVAGLQVHLPASALPTARTVPMSMPPDPVTGLCSLPRWATMPQTISPTRLASPPASALICVKLAASTLSALTSMRISLSAIDIWLSIFHAPWGNTPRGSITRWVP
jgi:hypothetical protein